MENQQIRLQQQMQFILELDRLKYITRQTYIADGSRKENDAEHSWHLALMCLLLDEYSNETIDKLKVISMVLIHDVVEIDAGDTYAYDETGNATKRERELLAANRIFKLLPNDQAVKMRALWDEFEEGKTAEALFANSLDKIQPILLNDATDGKAWKEHDVYRKQIVGRNEKTPKGSAVLWNYAKKLIDTNVIKGNVKEKD